jgi:hypothetical protein
MRFLLRVLRKNRAERLRILICFFARYKGENPVPNRGRE